MILTKEHLNLLLEAGVHYGHKSWKRNPKMDPYIHGTLNGINIIDLRQTLILLNHALQEFQKVVKHQGKVLFICTKTLHSTLIEEMAIKYKQYYVNYKWPGGLITNWSTSMLSIQKMKKLRDIIKHKNKYHYTKKEFLKIENELEKKEKVFAGCANMKLSEIKIAVVFDTLHNANAVKELRALGIPIIGIVDTNANPDLIDFVIPGNDDSSKAMGLYIQFFTQALADSYAGEKKQNDSIDEALKKEFGLNDEKSKSNEEEVRQNEQQ